MAAEPGIRLVAVKTLAEKMEENGNRTLEVVGRFHSHGYVVKRGLTAAREGG